LGLPVLAAGRKHTADVAVNRPSAAVDRHRARPAKYAWLLLIGVLRNMQAKRHSPQRCVHKPICLAKSMTQRRWWRASAAFCRDGREHVMTQKK